ncbi:MAG: FUSC family protein, partial [Rhizobiales bacterium]|nr:FUSC family protein [Hyphomicrobiales bacterium]
MATSDISERARGDGLPARLLDRIAASDPALSRLRLASRAMLSPGLSGALLGGFTLLHPLPIAAYGMTAVISFTGSMSVRDRSVRAQTVTRAIAAVAAIASVLLASLLSPIPLVADLAFLAVIFAAVYARQYGPRGFSVGMIAFMAYFIGDYLRPTPSDIGWIAMAIVVAIAV